MKFHHDATLGAKPFLQGRRVYDPPIKVKSGEEMGMFEFGSTIVLFAPGQHHILKEPGEACFARQSLLAGSLTEQN
jgi:hypothetical protein